MRNAKYYTWVSCHYFSFTIKHTEIPLTSVRQLPATKAIFCCSLVCVCCKRESTCAGVWGVISLVRKFPRFVLTSFSRMVSYCVFSSLRFGGSPDIFLSSGQLLLLTPLQYGEGIPWEPLTSFRAPMSSHPSVPLRHTSQQGVWITISPSLWSNFHQLSDCDIRLKMLCGLWVQVAIGYFEFLDVRSWRHNLHWLFPAVYPPLRTVKMVLVIVNGGTVAAL